MTARQELDRLCSESWVRFGHDLRATGQSMGRIGLSCARRHPALLLGGGALLAFGATMWLTRGKRREKREREHELEQDGLEQEQVEGRADGVQHDHDGRDGAHARRRRKPAKDSLTKHFALGAVSKILRNAARMWLLQHLSSELRAESEEEEETSDGELHAESAS
jgi:hypothetical protein